MPNEQKEILEHERGFHDSWAKEIDVGSIAVDRYFEGSTSPENRFILSQLGDVAGKLLLDLGCGAGENSVYFASKGARCVATDCSPGMLEKAVELAQRNGVEIKTKVVDANTIDFPDNYFDIVYCANILHHVDVYRCLGEIHRVLKPGGKCCFWEPLKHNPVINIYRKMATGVRTEDEHPLDIHIVKHVRTLFSHMVYDTFWLATLWIFVRFFLIERVDPNKERYWKKIIYEEERLRLTYLRLERLDRVVKQIPFMRRFAWNIAVVATK